MINLYNAPNFPMDSKKFPFLIVSKNFAAQDVSFASQFICRYIHYYEQATYAQFYTKRDRYVSVYYMILFAIIHTAHCPTRRTCV